MAFPLPFGQPQQPAAPVLPRVPWNQNPMVTTAAFGLLGGRNLNEGLANVAQAAPAGMVAKSGMQQFMLAKQEKDAEKAAAEARKQQMNEVMKAWPGLTPEQRALFSAQPELFGQYAVGTMTPPKPTDDISEYNFAKSQGFNGTFQDYQIAMKKAGASNVSVDNVGTIPQGYELTTDPATGAKRMQPIAGGPADTTKTDAAKNEQKGRYGDVVLEDIRRAKDKVKNQSWYAPVTGLGGQLLSGVGGSAAGDTAQLISTIESSISFDRLQAMRESSPTGGALGAVSERELQLLSSTLGSVKQSQSQEQLLQNLDRLEKIYEGIMSKVAAYPNAAEFGFSGSAADGTGWTEVEPGVKIREKP